MKWLGGAIAGATASAALGSGYALGMDDLVWGLGNLGLTLQGVPDDAFKVLLVHEPDFADEATKAGVDLQLSGHSHVGRFYVIGF